MLRTSIVRFALLVATLQVAACVAEVGEPGDEVEAEAIGSELRWRRPLPPPNPCAVTQCAAGTVCQVQDGAAVCVPGPTPPDPAQCGKVTCSPGYLCCNASCGICVQPGFACHQLACN